MKREANRPLLLKPFVLFKIRLFPAKKNLFHVISALCDVVAQIAWSCRVSATEFSPLAHLPLPIVMEELAIADDARNPTSCRRRSMYRSKRPKVRSPLADMVDETLP